MTESNSDGAHRAAWRVCATVLGICLMFGATACGGGEEDEEEVNHSEASDESTVVGATDGRLQLTEGVDYKLRTAGDTVGKVRLTGNEEGDDPAVVISVSEGKDSEEEYTLSLGDTVDIGDGVWRVSEIGTSTSDSQPGSATLIRNEN